METMGGLVERIVPRNQTIPVAKAQDFTTYKDGQTALALHVVQGERDLVQTAAAWRGLSCAASRPWRPVRRASASPSPVDADGLLSVSAQGADQRREAQHRRQAQLRPGRRPDRPHAAGQLCHRRADMQARAWWRPVDADRMLLATQSALDADGDLLDAPERAEIDALMASCAPRSRPRTTDAAAIEAATQAWPKAPKALPPQRMNRRHPAGAGRQERRNL
jgi:molecular chaperone HscA